jgi:hypothetical protein
MSIAFKNKGDVEESFSKQGVRARLEEEGDKEVATNRLQPADAGGYS